MKEKKHLPYVEDKQEYENRGKLDITILKIEENQIILKISDMILKIGENQIT